MTFADSVVIEKPLFAGTAMVGTSGISEIPRMPSEALCRIKTADPADGRRFSLGDAPAATVPVFSQSPSTGSSSGVAPLWVGRLFREVGSRSSPAVRLGGKPPDRVGQTFRVSAQSGSLGDRPARASFRACHARFILHTLEG